MRPGQGSHGTDHWKEYKTHYSVLSKHCKHPICERSHLSGLHREARHFGSIQPNQREKGILVRQPCTRLDQDAPRGSPGSFTGRMPLKLLTFRIDSIFELALSYVHTPPLLPGFVSLPMAYAGGKTRDSRYADLCSSGAEFISFPSPPRFRASTLVWAQSHGVGLGVDPSLVREGFFSVLAEPDRRMLDRPLPRRRPQVSTRADELLEIRWRVGKGEEKRSRSRARKGKS